MHEKNLYRLDGWEILDKFILETHGLLDWGSKPNQKKTICCARQKETICSIAPWSSTGSLAERSTLLGVNQEGTSFTHATNRSFERKYTCTCERACVCV